MLSSEKILVPSLLVNVDFTCNGIWYIIAVCTADGCMTLAPSEDNSSISSYEILSIFFATGILFGSLEYIPSTSVKISHVSVSKSFAIATAVASDPPLPVVVTSPFSDIP